MYATSQDIIDRYGLNELLVVADLNGDGTPDSALVEQALADASSLIDGFLARRYSLPLPTVPKLLVELCVDMAIYKLSPVSLPNEERRKRHEDALKLLGKIGSGEVLLGAAFQQTSTGVSGAYFSCNKPVFRRGM